MWYNHCRSICPHKVHKRFIVSIFHRLVREFGVDVDKLTALELNMEETENFPNDLSMYFAFFPLTSEISRLSCLCEGRETVQIMCLFCCSDPTPTSSSFQTFAAGSCGNENEQWASQLKVSSGLRLGALWALCFCIAFLPWSQKSLVFQLWKGGQWGTENTSDSVGCSSLSEVQRLWL